MNAWIKLIEWMNVPYRVPAAVLRQGGWTRPPWPATGSHRSRAETLIKLELIKTFLTLSNTQSAVNTILTFTIHQFAGFMMVKN